MARAPSAVFQDKFKCLLHHRNGRPPKNDNWTRGTDDMEAFFVFFSTSEELKLPATGPMDLATTLSSKVKPLDSESSLSGKPSS